MTPDVCEILHHNTYGNLFTRYDIIRTFSITLSLVTAVHGRSSYINIYTVKLLPASCINLTSSLTPYSTWRIDDDQRTRAAGEQQHKYLGTLPHTGTIHHSDHRKFQHRTFHPNFRPHQLARALRKTPACEHSSPLTAMNLPHLPHLLPLIHQITGRAVPPRHHNGGGG